MGSRLTRLAASVALVGGIVGVGGPAYAATQTVTTDVVFSCSGADPTSQALLDGLANLTGQPVPAVLPITVTVNTTQPAGEVPVGSTQEVSFTSSVALSADLLSKAKDIGVQTISVENIQVKSSLSGPGTANPDLTTVNPPDPPPIDLTQPGVPDPPTIGPFSTAITNNGQAGQVNLGLNNLQLTATVNLLQGEPLVLNLDCPTNTGQAVTIGAIGFGVQVTTTTTTTTTRPPTTTAPAATTAAAVSGTTSYAG